MPRYMTKLIVGLAISGLASSIAIAQDNVVKITVNCPKIGNSSGDVVNYGISLAGEGDERINGGAPVDLLFQAPMLVGSNIPVDLKASGYNNSGTSYNASTGAVMCKYSSSKGFSPFAIGYSMVNALSGTITGSGNQSIHIKFPVGLI